MTGKKGRREKDGEKGFVPAGQGRRVRRTAQGPKLLAAGLTLALAVGLVGLGSRLRDYYMGARVYAEAETLAGLPEWDPPSVATAAPPPTSAVTAPSVESGGALPTPEPTPPPTPDPYAQALRDMDFSALREYNPEVAGWIVIPGTPLSYPLMKGTDNTYYLDHTWKKTRSAVGAVFMEQSCDAALGGFNTILYGHGMHNSSMFGSLKRYREQSYRDAHPAVYLINDGGSYKYDIFAAYEADVTGPAYWVEPISETGRAALLKNALEKSVITAAVEPTVSDRVVTLSTCTGKGYATRWVVQGVCKAEPAAPVEIPAGSVVPEGPDGSDDVPEQETPGQPPQG